MSSQFCPAFVAQLQGERPRQQGEVERHGDGAVRSHCRRLGREQPDHALQDRGGPPVGVGLAVDGVVVRGRPEPVRLLGEHPLVGVEQDDGADVLLLHALAPQRPHDPLEELEREREQVLDPEVARGELLDELGVPAAADQRARGRAAGAGQLVPPLLRVEDLHARHERQRLDAAADDEELLGGGEQGQAALQHDERVVPALQHHLADVQVAARAEAAHAQELRRAPHRRDVEGVQRHGVAVAEERDRLERLADPRGAGGQLDDVAAGLERRLAEVLALGHQRVLHRRDKPADLPHDQKTTTNFQQALTTLCRSKLLSPRRTRTVAGDPVSVDLHRRHSCDEFKKRRVDLPWARVKLYRSQAGIPGHDSPLQQ
ncbi:hypothetical protein Zm00014a_018499 [Zea mays]|uniref:Uncharacterized protein n=1 Tax=Zea mays TaxID=4577 RepID=A0A3L6E356_MAIZE|nr:hypothetical protein Zm00014a_018499 [Zea mays]